MKRVLFLSVGMGFLIHVVQGQTLLHTRTRFRLGVEATPQVYSWLDSHAQKTDPSCSGFAALSQVGTTKLAPLASIPPDYYARHWGVFCQFEWQTYQHLKIPLSIRLGTLEYENSLEGKP